VTTSVLPILFQDPTFVVAKVAAGQSFCDSCGGWANKSYYPQERKQTALPCLVLVVCTQIISITQIAWALPPSETADLTFCNKGVCDDSKTQLPGRESCRPSLQSKKNVGLVANCNRHRWRILGPGTICFGRGPRRIDSLACISFYIE
jgi:hypothetical protein